MPPLPTWAVDLLGWSWLGAVALLALVALRSSRAWVRVALVVMSWASIWDRESGVGVLVRGAVWDRHQAGLNVDDFRAGALAVSSYLDRTGPQVLIPVVALGMAAVWGRGGSPEHERPTRTGKVLRVLGAAAGALLLAWFVAAMATRSLGNSAYVSLIGGLFLLANAAIRRPSGAHQDGVNTGDDLERRSPGTGSG